MKVTWDDDIPNIWDDYFQLNGKIIQMFQTSNQLLTAVPPSAPPADAKGSTLQFVHWES